MEKKRRDFLKTAGLGLSTATLSYPFSVRAADKKTFQWKMVTTWPKNFPGLGTGAAELAQRIQKMSDGRIKIKVFGAGELVPAMGVFDAVSRGTAEMGHSAAYYWKGKHEATQFFGAVPFGLNGLEMNAWLRYGGGQKLWDNLYSDFGLKPFSAGNTGVQMGGWYNKPINTEKDFKGLKMRMPGLGGSVLSSLGATVVNVPGGELFQSIKTGAIDALEWVGPYNDQAFGFYKAAKFYYWPGWHEPGSNLECIINKKAFAQLPKDLQMIVEVACQSVNDDMFAEFTARNAASLQDLTGKHKVQIKKFPNKVLKAIAKKSVELEKALAKTDAVTGKIQKSYDAFRKQAISWNRISEEGYSIARTEFLG